MATLRPARLDLPPLCLNDSVILSISQQTPVQNLSPLSSGYTDIDLWSSNQDQTLQNQIRSMTQTWMLSRSPFTTGKKNSLRLGPLYGIRSQQLLSTFSLNSPTAAPSVRRSISLLVLRHQSRTSPCKAITVQPKIESIASWTFSSVSPNTSLSSATPKWTNPEMAKASKGGQLP